MQQCTVSLCKPRIYLHFTFDCLATLDHIFCFIFYLEMGKDSVELRMFKGLGRKKPTRALNTGEQRVGIESCFLHPRGHFIMISPP